MKLWIDDVRPAPEGYDWAKSVYEAREIIEFCENPNRFPSYCPPGRHYDPIEIELIDIDHDASDYASDGGDYIRLLDWLEATGRNYPIRIHSQNPVGVANMRRIIERNGWKEVF
jgi:hypothetical protein